MNLIKPLAVPAIKTEPAIKPVFSVRRMVRGFVSRVLYVADHFEKLPMAAKFVVWRGVATIVVCVIVIGVFGINLVMAEQDGEHPSTMYEEQEYEQLKATDHEVEAVKQKIADIEADRQQRRSENQAWKAQFDASLRESRERQSRDEGMGIAAVTLIGILQSMGLVRKFKSEEEKLEARINVDG